MALIARPLRIRGKALESPRKKPTFRYLIVHGPVTTAQKWAERGGFDPIAETFEEGVPREEINPVHTCKH